MIAAYATDGARPAIPFWQSGANRAAAEELSASAAAADLVHGIARCYPLEDIAAAHEAVERGDSGGRILIDPCL